MYPLRIYGFRVQGEQGLGFRVRLSGPSLKLLQVDELVFVAAHGLHIGAIGVASSDEARGLGFGVSGLGFQILGRVTPKKLNQGGLVV